MVYLAVLLSILNYSKFIWVHIQPHHYLLHHFWMKTLLHFAVFRLVTLVNDTLYTNRIVTDNMWVGGLPLRYVIHFCIEDMIQKILIINSVFFCHSKVMLSKWKPIETLNKSHFLKMFVGDHRLSEWHNHWNCEGIVKSFQIRKYLTWSVL